MENGKEQDFTTHISKILLSNFYSAAGLGAI